MAEEANPAAFTDWLAAESAAYMAIHQLHQRSQGGLRRVPDHCIEQIARLRKEADQRFASVARTQGAPLPQPATVAPAQRRLRPRPAFELVSRVPVDRPRTAAEIVCAPVQGSAA
jgi:hypothetical protein|uniref:hypothetical protein n=1 Tax=Variovorax sp. BK018 TaxID=3450241 RepID=UPI004039BE2F